MRLLHAILCLSVSACAVAQQSTDATVKPEEPTLSHTIDAVKMTTPPTIDGTINDDEWKSIQPMTGMVDAMTGETCPEPAIFWLGYDDKYIYFAAKLHDSNPSAIKMTEYRQNASLGGDDTVQLDIDPYGALTDWSHFTINPRGATQIQIAGGRAAKREWIGDFVAKSRVTADGWEAEARIPWALMKLPGSGKREVRFDFDRSIARTNRIYDWTNTVGGDLRGVGKWQAVEVPKIQEDRILQLLPYTYQGADRKDGLIANGGIDMKMPITEQMTLVGTVNPDFRNIENQILSIDFSRFERLAGESRPFFQEGSQYYGSALIATQRFKDFDSGFNVYGKVNSQLAMGMINTSDFGNENDFATTMQYSPNASSNIRFSHTNMDSDTVKNRGYLLAYSNQLSKSLNLFLRGMSTQDATNGKGEERNVSLGYQHGEMFGNVQYRQISPKFLPRLGFSPERDYRGVNASTGFDHPMKGAISDFAMDVYANKYERFDGGNYRRGTGGDITLAYKNDLVFNGNVDFQQFLGSNDHTYTASLTHPRNDPYRNISTNVTWGRIEGFQYQSIGVGSSYRPMKNLQLGLNSQFVKYQGNDKQLILSCNYDLGGDRSLSGRVVQGNRHTNAYIALQRSGGAGIEYFLILGDPNAQSFRSSLILKVTYPLQMFLNKHSH